jgi:hypothetical protein
MWTKALRTPTNTLTGTILKIASIGLPEDLLLTVKLCGIILGTTANKSWVLPFMAPWLPALSAKLKSFK